MLAFVAALTWSLLPVLCPNAEAAKPRHSHAASAEGADDSEAPAHQHPAHHDSKQCCTTLMGAKFVAPVSASAPTPKLVLGSAAAIIAKLSIDHRQVADMLLARDATGPPKRSPPRFINYRPLAPPSFG